ncbi:MAG: hypothetical protein M3151_13100 [Actinomycetota bacterium]|nr:hypothetical protein [Actinomycetota bacterium]
MSEQHNPLLMLVGQTEDMRRGFYNDLALRVEVDDEDVRICGVIGSRCCTHLDVGDEEIEAAVEVAATLSATAPER